MNTPMNEAERALDTWHLYTDAQGQSHFRQVRLPLRPLTGPRSTSATAPAGAPDNRPLAAHRLAGANSASFLSIRRGAVEDWHCAPRRQYVVVVRGTAEVTASDGEARRFGPGSIILMDDTSGKGHITRALGDEDHIALMLPVE